MASPLSIAVLGVSSLETARAFYQDVIGLNASEPEHVKGDAFEAHWRLPKGSAAKAVLFSARGSKVGRVLAIEFNNEFREKIIRPGDRTYRGLWNLNFYVDDIRATTRALQAKGYAFWSEPVGYEVSAEAGQPVEVLFDGPDGLAINLVELTGDETTAVGKLRAIVDEQGKTKTGFTQVATTSHSITDHEKALAFYRQVLGLKVFIDDVLHKPETNHFLGRPHDARTRATFVASDHPFGKIALSHPLNYQVSNKVDLAQAPNIGYLAQSFLVSNLDDALKGCVDIGARVYSEPVEINVPGEGINRVGMVCNPGSGALMELIEGDYA